MARNPDFSRKVDKSDEGAGITLAVQTGIFLCQGTSLAVIVSPMVLLKNGGYTVITPSRMVPKVVIPAPPGGPKMVIPALLGGSH